MRKVFVPRFARGGAEIAGEIPRDAETLNEKNNREIIQGPRYASASHAQHLAHEERYKTGLILGRS